MQDQQDGSSLDSVISCNLPLESRLNLSFLFCKRKVMIIWTLGIYQPRDLEQLTLETISAGRRGIEGGKWDNE